MRLMTLQNPINYSWLPVFCTAVLFYLPAADVVFIVCPQLCHPHLAACRYWFSGCFVVGYRFCRDIYSGIAYTL